MPSRRRPPQPELGGSVITKNVWNRLRHHGRLVRDEVTGHLPPLMRPLAWEQFKRMPLARSACTLLALLEPPQAAAGLYRRGTRRPAGAGLFDDIPSLIQRAKAEKIYAGLCERHALRLASCSWLLPILAGRARWLATHPDTRGSAWGRRMRRQKAGKHTQQRYREEGRHPLPSVRKAWGFTAERLQGASELPPQAPSYDETSFGSNLTRQCVCECLLNRASQASACKNSTL